MNILLTLSYQIWTDLYEYVKFYEKLSHAKYHQNSDICRKILISDLCEKIVISGGHLYEGNLYGITFCRWVKVYKKNRHFI